MKQFPEYESYAITSMGYNSQIVFYEKQFKVKDYDVQQKLPNQLDIGEKALTCENQVMDILKNRFEYEILEEWKSCNLVSITAICDNRLNYNNLGSLHPKNLGLSNPKSFVPSRRIFLDFIYDFVHQRRNYF